MEGADSPVPAQAEVGKRSRNMSAASEVHRPGCGDKVQQRASEQILIAPVSRMPRLDTGLCLPVPPERPGAGAHTSDT